VTHNIDAVKLLRMHDLILVWIILNCLCKTNNNLPEKNKKQFYSGNYMSGLQVIHAGDIKAVLMEKTDMASIA
jgi:hypothetical protein